MITFRSSYRKCLGLAFGILCSFGLSGCAKYGQHHDQDFLANSEPSPHCFFSIDETGFISDADFARSDIDLSAYTYVRDKLVGNSNYQNFIDVINSTNEYYQWIMASYGRPGESDYGITYIQFSKSSCTAYFVRAVSGSRGDFDIDKGFAKFKSCSIPAYFFNPMSVTENTISQVFTISPHQSYDFLNWGVSSGKRCGLIVTKSYDLTWLSEFMDGSFFEESLKD